MEFINVLIQKTDLKFNKISYLCTVSIGLYILKIEHYYGNKDLNLKINVILATLCEEVLIKLFNYYYCKQ